MQRRKTLLTALTVLIACALACALVNSAYAAYATSIIYTKFNSTNWSEYALDQTYDYLAANIKCRLAITTDNWSKVAFFNQSTTNDGTADPQGIIVIFNNQGDVKVYYADGLAEVELGAGKYYGNTTDVRIVLSDGKVTVYTNYGDRATQEKIVDGFSFAESISHIRVKGTHASTATDGYVQVDVNMGASGNVGAIVNAWFPVIVTFALLGVVLGLLKKYAK